NPPYGEGRRGEEAVRFIEHALELGVPRVAMLLRNDFDSAISRQHLFRHNPTFAGKLVLLNRIKWFDGPSSPSDNHAWFCWGAITEASHRSVTLPVLRRKLFSGGGHDTPFSRATPDPAAFPRHLSTRSARRTRGRRIGLTPDHLARPAGSAPFSVTSGTGATSSATPSR